MHTHFLIGVAMVTHVRKNPVIQPEPKTCSSTRAASRNTKIFLSAPRKEEEEEEEEGGYKKKTEFNYTVETHSLPSGSDISTI